MQADYCRSHRDPPEGAALTGEALLLCTAAAWGLSFVAQRAGSQHVGPFTFNAVRFGLPALLLGAALGGLRCCGRRRDGDCRQALLPGMGLGVVVFAAASLQQVGIVHTTAAKAGFITGLYVVLVPLLGLVLGHRPQPMHWAGALCAAAGLYHLSVQENLTVAPGDLHVFACACLWAIHVLATARFARAVPWLALAVSQFATCALLSAAAVLLWETVVLEHLQAALVPLLYAGIVAVGIGNTLQVVGQRRAAPAPAAVILGLEAVFAAAGGWILLGEALTLRELAGCLLMLAGTLLSALTGARRRAGRAKE